MLYKKILESIGFTDSLKNQGFFEESVSKNWQKFCPMRQALRVKAQERIKSHDP
jgi:hypothetical protein